MNILIVNNWNGYGELVGTAYLHVQQRWDVTWQIWVQSVWFFNCSLLHYVNYVQWILELFADNSWLLWPKKPLFFICLKLHTKKNIHERFCSCGIFRGSSSCLFVSMKTSSIFYPFFLKLLDIQNQNQNFCKWEISSAQQPKDHGILIDNNNSKRINNMIKR